MAITINGSGTITGISAGGLPDNCITAADLATTLDLSSSTLTLPSGTGGKFESVAVVTDRKTSGTHAGASVANSWTTRDLNNELFDPDGIVSLSSNQFTLAAGSYVIEWSAPFHDVGYVKTMLYNVTDSTTSGEGEGSYIHTSYDITFWMKGVARVTITGSKAFEIRYNCSSARANYGLGISTSRGSYEYYTTVKIFKEV